MGILETELARQSRYEDVAKQFDGMQRLFVPANSPIVQDAMEAPTERLFDLDTANVTALADEYRKRQENYDTAPFDPEGDKFRMFPGGVTIWSGFPGSGKTTLLRQVVCHLLHKGRGVFVASLEERPDDMLVRLMQTAAGTLDPTPHQMQWFIDAYGSRLRLWGMIGLAKNREVLAAIRGLAEHGIRHAVIDSLTCLDVGASDWDGQRGFANDLVNIARVSGVHVHLVAHPRKPSNPQQQPDIADIAGSSDLGRLVDNVVFVRRATDDESQNFGDATTMRLTIRKQRHGTGMCGDIFGYFHRNKRQFSRDQFLARPVRYLPDDAYEPAA